MSTTAGVAANDAGLHAVGARRVELAIDGGRCSAWVCGDGPLVVLLHGFPDGPATFVHQLPALATAGFRAAAVTLRGYEASSLPANGDLHVNRLAQDVFDAADALGEAGAFNLVGHDWGASIAYAAAALHPQRVLTLTALAVPHPAQFASALLDDPAQLARSSYLMAVQQVGAAEAQLRADGFAALQALWSGWSPRWSESSAAFEAVRERFAVPGVLEAALGYYRQALDTTSGAGQASQLLYTSPIEATTLLLHGEDDGCIGADYVRRVAVPGALFRQWLRVQFLAGAGHFLHQELPASVNEALVKHLRAANRREVYAPAHARPGGRVGF